MFFQLFNNPLTGIENAVAGLWLGSFAFFDGITQFLGFRTSNNNIRFTTGLLGGFGICFLSFYLNTPLIQLVG